MTSDETDKEKIEDQSPTEERYVTIRQDLWRALLKIAGRQIGAMREIDSLGKNIELDADGRHWIVVVNGLRIGGFKTEAEARRFLDSRAGALHFPNKKRTASNKPSAPPKEIRPVTTRMAKRNSSRLPQNGKGCKKLQSEERACGQMGISPRLDGVDVARQKECPFLR